MAAKSGLHQDMLLPHHTFLCPPHPSSPPPIDACCCKSFFLFFSSFIPCHLNLSAATLSLLLPPPPLALTQAIPHHCHIILGGIPTTCCTPPHTGHRHTKATLPPSPSPCLVHLQKKPQIGHFPFFFPFIFNGARYLPLICMQATPSLVMNHGRGRSIRHQK